MTKTFCDACFKKVSDVIDFSYLLHVDEVLNYELGKVTSKTKRVSKTLKHYGLCRKCYNRIMVESVRKLHEVRKNGL